MNRPSQRPITMSSRMNRHPRDFRHCGIGMCRPVRIPDNIKTLHQAIIFLYDQCERKAKWDGSKVEYRLRQMGFIPEE